MNSYQEHALDGASAVDLVVALYDGMIRFLCAAMARWSATTHRDGELRSAAPWTSLFTWRRVCAWMWAASPRRRSATSMRPCLPRSCRPRSRRRSRSSSMRFDCIRNVRDAWRQVARDPEVNPAPAQVGFHPAQLEGTDYGPEATVRSWNA